MTDVEVIDTQNRIIRLQSDVINSLCLELMHHITAEEADALPVVKKINIAAEMRKMISD